MLDLTLQGKQGYTAKQLVAAVRIAKQNPQILIKVSWSTNMTARDYIKWFRDSLNRKINRNDQRRNFKKFDDSFHSNLKYDAMVINEFAKGIRRTGTQNLKTDLMRRLYPEVNNQIREIEF